MEHGETVRIALGDGEKTVRLVRAHLEEDAGKSVHELGGDAALTSRVILLVQSKQGYLNLCELLARAWTQNIVKNTAVVKLEWLKELGYDKQ